MACNSTMQSVKLNIYGLEGVFVTNKNLIIAKTEGRRKIGPCPRVFDCVQIERQVCSEAATKQLLVKVGKYECLCTKCCT